MKLLSSSFVVTLLFNHAAVRVIEGLTSVDRGTFLRMAAASGVSNSGKSSEKLDMSISSKEGDNEKYVCYTSIDVPLEGYGIDIPVAIWSPISKEEVSRVTAYSMNTKYDHQISVSRIGELLAGWKLPSFLKRSYELDPYLSKNVVDGNTVDGFTSAPNNFPLVMFAHGYLGSRFDMSHIAETLAQDGFICVSPEYPESLAASYERIDGIDRSMITSSVLDSVVNKMNIQNKKRGIIGHSLGCGTALSTGDSSWARICIAGFAPTILEGATLCITSVNDGAVPWARIKDRIPGNFNQISEETSLIRPNEYEQHDMDEFPKQSIVILQRPDAPNHISFLCDGVNNAMIDLLSPLLPVAQALKIPVLDFDKYKISQDSEPTAQLVIPMVRKFLRENLK